MFMRDPLWTPIDPAPVLLVALPFPKTKGEVGCKALSSILGTFFIYDCIFFENGLTQEMWL